VILKLIGASGFVYSEEEADSLKQAGGNYIPPEKEPAPTPTPPATKEKSDEPDEWEALLREIDVKMKNIKTHKDLLDFMNGGHFKDRMAAMQIADPHKYHIARDILVRMNTKLKIKG